MYDLDWAKEVCNDLQHARPKYKESLRELFKITAVYLGLMVTVGGSTMALSLFASRYAPDKEIKNVKTYIQDNKMDTINIKTYSDKQTQFEYIHHTAKSKHR